VEAERLVRLDGRRPSFIIWRKAFPLGQIRWPIDFARETKGTSLSPLRFGLLQLLADDLFNRQSYPLRHFLKPDQQPLARRN
jgi:hypothetical protein